MSDDPQFKKLQGWVAKQALVPRNDATLQRVVLRHMVSKSSKRLGEEIATYSPPVDQDALEDWIAKAVEECWGQINHEVSVLGGIQTFALYSFFSDDLAKSASRLLLKVANDEEEDFDDTLMSEGSSVRGMLQQNQRHLEATQKMFMGAFASMVSSMQRQNARLADQNEKLIAERNHTFDTQMQLMRAEVEQHNKERELEMKQKSMESAIEAVKQIAPAIVNKMAGQKIMDEAPGSDAFMAAKIMFRGLSDEQYAEIQKNMTKEQFAAFVSWGESVSNPNGEAPEHETS